MALQRTPDEPSPGAGIPGIAVVNRENHRLINAGPIHGRHKLLWRHEGAIRLEVNMKVDLHSPFS